MRIARKVKNIIRYIKQKEKIPIIVPTGNEDLLKDKVILITGGSGGIGRTIAERCMNCGGKVIIAGTREEKLKRICSDNEGMSYLVLDLTKPQTFADKIDTLHVNIDILINCAGVNDTTEFLKVTEECFDAIMDVNIRGAYFLSQEVAQKMIHSKTRGHILNVSSASALRPASAPYAISKWALSGMTKGLADYLIPYGITVNAIAPGPTAAGMLQKDNDNISNTVTPIGRYATAIEIANLAIFMVSQMGDLIVGDTYYITGGSGTVSLHR